MVQGIRVKNVQIMDAVALLEAHSNFWNDGSGGVANWDEWKSRWKKEILEIGGVFLSPKCFYTEIVMHG